MVQYINRPINIDFIVFPPFACINQSYTYVYVFYSFRIRLIHDAQDIFQKLLPVPVLWYGCPGVGNGAALPCIIQYTYLVKAYKEPLQHSMCHCLLQKMKMPRKILFKNAKGIKYSEALQHLEQAIWNPIHQMHALKNRRTLVMGIFD